MKNATTRAPWRSHSSLGIALMPCSLWGFLPQASLSPNSAVSLAAYSRYRR